MDSRPSILSNLHKKPFIMNDCCFQSIEGFLQGLRVENENEQKRIFMLYGAQAKVSGKNHPIKNQFLVAGTKQSNEAKLGAYPDLAEQQSLTERLRDYFSLLGRAVSAQQA